MVDVDQRQQVAQRLVHVDALAHQPQDVVAEVELDRVLLGVDEARPAVEVGVHRGHGRLDGRGRHVAVEGARAVPELVG